MCVPCVLQVSRAFTFKQLCQRSDQTLRTFYREIENCMSNSQQSDSLQETKAIVVNKTSENNVSLMEIVSKSITPVPTSITEPLSTSTTSSLPSLNDNKLNINNSDNQSFDIQFQSLNNIGDENLNKCFLIVNNESAELTNSALDAQVNVSDNDIVSLISTTASDENQLVDTENFASIDQENNVENFIKNAIENNLQSTDSINGDIKVEVLSVLDSHVMESDLIDEHFGWLKEF